ncbi:MAG: TonB-dependent receptor [Bacteroidales bacterium]|nr:TonB-dependent receptor [Bacteroidales bacterium]
MPGSNLLSLLLISLFIIIPVLINAQDRACQEPDTLVSPALNEVVVTASRFNSQVVNTTEAIRVLNNESIEKTQSRSAPEALSLTPGVFVQKTNHGGGSPFVRGLTGNQTLLLIDGIRLSNSTTRYGPNQYFNTIDIFSLGKIEVLRGNGSVQYGSDALGGTVQAFTPQLDISGQPGWDTRMLARFGTHGMEKSFNLNSTYSNNSFALRAGLTYRDFGDVMGGDTTGRQSPSGYREFDYDVKGKIAVSKKSSVTFAFHRVNQKDVPVYHKVVLENYLVNNTDPQTRKLAYVRLNQDLNRRILKSAVVTGSFQHTHEGREMQKNGSDMLRKESDKVRTYGLSGELLLSSANVWNGNVGVEVYSDLVKSSRTDTDLLTDESVSKRGLYPDGSSMTSAALFSTHSFNLDKWILSAGARFNAFSIRVKDEANGTITLTPNAIVGNIGILRKITSTDGLFVSLNTGFRAPNIDDLGTLGIVDFRYEKPNFDLKPEKSFQYQFGYRHNGKKLKGEFFIYRNELYDLITRNRVENQTIEGYPLYQKENSDRAFIQGIETSWDLYAGSSFVIQSTLTYTYGQNITNDEPLRRIPPLFGRLAVEYNLREYLFCLEWLAASKQSRLAQGDIDDNRIPYGGTPGWNIFNLNTRYSFKFVNVDLTLRNILNKDYRYHGSGINGYGRSLFLTIAINF